VSDTASKDPSTDRSGPILKELFSATSDTWAIHSVAIVPDETSAIQSQVISWSDEGVNLIITSGGTGFAIRDITPEVISAIRL
jgi:gephyrin